MVNNTGAAGEGESAPELMDQIATEPALDELMARSPDHFTPERRRALVQRLRAERAAWENKRGQGAEPAPATATE